MFLGAALVLQGLRVRGAAASSHRWSFDFITSLTSSSKVLINKEPKTKDQRPKTNFLPELKESTNSTETGRWGAALSSEAATLQKKKKKRQGLTGR